MKRSVRNVVNEFCRSECETVCDLMDNFEI